MSDKLQFVDSGRRDDKLKSLSDIQIEALPMSVAKNTQVVYYLDRTHGRTLAERAVLRSTADKGVELIETMLSAKSPFAKPPSLSFPVDAM